MKMRESAKLLILLTSTLISMGTVNALLCHRCSFFKPYNLFTQPYVNPMIDKIDHLTGRNYKYSAHCENLPLPDDLVEATPLTMTQFLKNFLLLAFKIAEEMEATQLNSSMSETSSLNHFLSDKLKFEEFKIAGNFKTASKKEVEPQPMCLSARMNLAIQNILFPSLTVALRDGVILPNMTTGNLKAGICFDLENVVGFLKLAGANETIIEEFQKHVKEIELCACVVKDGCNSDDEGIGIVTTVSTTTVSTTTKSPTTPYPPLDSGTDGGSNVMTPGLVTLAALQLYFIFSYLA